VRSELPDGAAVDTVRQWTRSERIRAGIAYWVVVAVCLLVAGSGLYLVRLQGALTRTTQPISATIEHVEIISKKDAQGHATRQPLVLYSYTVGGVRYTTDRLTSLSRSHSDAWTTETAHRYHDGQTVTAFYNPLDPSSAFLEREFEWRAYGFLVVPLALALGLILYWPRAFAEEKGRRPSSEPSGSNPAP
jgi:hypothetical protein